MPQEFIYISRGKGTSKKGVDYDLITVSDGRATFALANDMGDEFPLMKEDQKFEAYIHVGEKYGALQGRIVGIAD